MHARQTILVVAASLALTSPAAHATTLFTAPARAENGSYLTCNVVNVGTKPIEVSSTVLASFDGSDMTDVSSCPVSPAMLDPGAACTAFSSSLGQHAGYCRFIVSSSKARAALVVLDGGFNVTATLPATK